LLLHATEERVDEILALEPELFSTAWPRDDQKLATIFAKAHERGCRVMHMVPRVDDAERAVAAGADVIVAQGNEGGGHIGELGTVVIGRQVAKAVAPVPVLAAGGFPDGSGLGAALAGRGRGARDRRGGGRDPPRACAYIPLASPITCPSGSAKRAIVTCGSSVTGRIVLPPSCFALSSVACGSSVST